MLDFQQQGLEEFRSRLFYCYLLVITLFLLVVPRLYYLQVARGRFFWVFSAEHTLKEIRIPATRGLLTDRHGVPIAENRPSFDLLLIRQHVRDIEAVKKSLQQMAAIPPELVDKKWGEARDLPPFFPLVIRSDLPYESAARLRVAMSVPSESGDSIDLRGVEVEPRPLRSYPAGAAAASLIGYLNEISATELGHLQKQKSMEYRLGDMIGAAGIERTWEKYLRGKDGYEQKIVNAAGMEVASDEVSSWLRNEEAFPGNDLTLTIDLELQKTAEESFVAKSGALVALDPTTGEILALVSEPSYDPAALVSNVSSDLWNSLVSDPRKLFLNRAIQGTYAPGSIFKIVTAIAGLEEGAIRADETLPCVGGVQFGGRFFRCWRSGGHGRIALHQALVQSCDSYFYQLGLRLGVDRIAKYARLLGLGQLTGIDLDREKSGTIPTTEWKKKLFGQEWQAGENLSIAVGQGYDTVTPMQAALMMAQVANGGRPIRPHLVKEIRSADGEELYREERPDSSGEAARLQISEATLAQIRSALADVVADPLGTAHGSRSEIVTIGGKTGTAQVISEEGRQRAGGGAALNDHAWFVAFAPVQNPKIAVAVIVEHGGFGASAAAPIAKKVIEKYTQLSNTDPVRTYGQ